MKLIVLVVLGVCLATPVCVYSSLPKTGLTIATPTLATGVIDFKILGGYAVTSVDLGSGHLGTSCPPSSHTPSTLLADGCTRATDEYFWSVSQLLACMNPSGTDSTGVAVTHNNLAYTQYTVPFYVTSTVETATTPDVITAQVQYFVPMNLFLPKELSFVVPQMTVKQGPVGSGAISGLATYVFGDGTAQHPNHAEISVKTKVTLPYQLDKTAVTITAAPATVTGTQASVVWVSTTAPGQGDTVLTQSWTLVVNLPYTDVAGVYSISIGLMCADGRTCTLSQTPANNVLAFDIEIVQTHSSDVVAAPDVSVTVAATFAAGKTAYTVGDAVTVSIAYTTDVAVVSSTLDSLKICKTTSTTACADADPSRTILVGGVNNENPTNGGAAVGLTHTDGPAPTFSFKVESDFFGFTLIPPGDTVAFLITGVIKDISFIPTGLVPQVPDAAQARPHHLTLMRSNAKANPVDLHIAMRVRRVESATAAASQLEVVGLAFLPL